MQFKKPKNDSKYMWTNHVIDKMMFYGISESLIKRIVRNPQRMEEGVAENTSAGMQARKVKEYKNGKPVKWYEEIWVMWQEVRSKNEQASDLKIKNQKSKIIDVFLLQNAKLRIISAWRYPGMSPERASIPIPDDILIEIEKML